jgi:homogentisate 1,2-dioxygenase
VQHGRDGVRLAGRASGRLRAAPRPRPTAGCRSRRRPLRAYAIEANSHISAPKRYLSRFGQFLEHAPYCERDLHAPSEPLLADGEDVEVLVKHRGNGPSGLVGTAMTYASHPFDVVGWDGCLYPYTFNVSDFEPITGACTSRRRCTRSSRGTTS